MDNTYQVPTKTEFILSKLAKDVHLLEEDLDQVYDFAILLGTLQLLEGSYHFDEENAALFHFLIALLREMKDAEKEYNASFGFLEVKRIEKEFWGRLADQAKTKDEIIRLQQERITKLEANLV